MAEFHAPAELVKAAHARPRRRATARWTPTPPTRWRRCIEALHLHHSHVPEAGPRRRPRRRSPAGWGLQYWTSVIEYPMNIGGRPFNAWPAFVVPAFETTVLFAALTAVFGMLALNGLPAALPPGLQRPGLRARQPRPLLPLHRGRRPEVRPRRRPASSCRGSAPRTSGGGAMTPRASGRRRERRALEAPGRPPRRATSSAAAPSSSCSPRRCGLPAGHARPAEVQAASGRASSSPTGARRAPSSRARWPAGTLREDTVLYTGKVGGRLRDRDPGDGDRRSSSRAGQTQFQVFCSPCHGRTGRGDGMIVQRGFKKPSSYHVDRLRQMPIGYFYDVITNGFGAMSDYAAQVPPAGPLGHRGLRPHAAAQPVRARRRRAGRQARRARPEPGRGPGRRSTTR